MSTSPVGFIGLGRMGRGMARNLLGAGVDLVVHDASPDAVAPLVEAGARAAPTPAALAAQVARVILCLPYTPEVESVLFDADGVIAAARPGLAIIDTTTLNYYDALRVAGRVGAAGHGYNDCPISGMPFRADDGTLTMMFGGDAEAFEAARPLLEAVGDPVIHCGPLGAGQMTKAINNIVYNINIAGVCEIMPLALAAGLSAETVERVLTTGSSRSFASEYFVPRFLERRFDSDFSMGAAYKDIVNVQEIALRLGAATPVMSAMVAQYQQAIAQGFGDEPKSAMVKLYESVLGVTAKRD